MQNRNKNAKPPVFRILDEDFWIAGCLDESDFERAARKGITTIVNILPEDDEMCILNDRQARRAAREAGLAYQHMPIYGHQLNNESFARAFVCLIAESKGPRLVYCRSGMRSAFLWGMIHAADLGVDEVLERTLDIGFDLSVIEEDLRHMAHLPSPLKALQKAAA